MGNLVSLENLNREQEDRIINFLIDNKNYFIYKNVMFSYLEYDDSVAAYIWYPKRSRIKWSRIWDRYILKKENRNQKENPYFILVWHSDSGIFENGPWEKMILEGINFILSNSIDYENERKKEKIKEIKKLISDWSDYE